MIGWFDGGAGASGDMLLGALVGAGVPLDVPSASVESLGLGLTLRAESVRRAGIGATRIHVEVPESSAVRNLSEILELLEALDAPVHRLAARVFERLGAAEAAVHGVRLQDVHFHEVGALDSIADVVGARRRADPPEPGTDPLLDPQPRQWRRPGGSWPTSGAGARCLGTTENVRQR